MHTQSNVCGFLVENLSISPRRIDASAKCMQALGTLNSFLKRKRQSNIVSRFHARECRVPTREARRA